MGLKPSITAELAVLRHVREAVEGKWSAEMLARAAGVGRNTAYKVLGEFKRKYVSQSVSQVTETPDGLWPALLKQAENDQLALSRISKTAKRTPSQDKELTNIILRLSAIAGAAKGRIPEADDNISPDYDSGLD